MFRHRTTEHADSRDVDERDSREVQTTDAPGDRVGADDHIEADDRGARERHVDSMDHPTATTDREMDHEESRPRSAAWSPAQIVALVIGGAAIVMGVVALARTGLNTDHWTTPVESVLGIEHTPVLALAEIGFGVLMVFSAMGPGGRPLMALLSTIALAFGIIVVVDGWSSSFGRWFAVSDANGWVYVVAGAIGLLSATMMPTVYHRERRSVHERRHVGRPHTVH